MVYPERNRKRGKHFNSRHERGGTNRLQVAHRLEPQRHTGGAAGRESSDTYLLLADLSKGLEAPEVTRLLLEKEHYYMPRLKNQPDWRRKYAGSILSATTLEFTKEDKAVGFTTHYGGAFAEQKAVVELE